MIEFDYNAKGFVDENDLNDEIELARSFVQRAQEDEFGGWVDLPINYNKEEFNRIKTAAERINLNSEYLVCIGIGGSYLGHRAVISALGNNSRTKVIYAGNSLSPYEIEKVLEEIGDSNFSINIISKSGTTTEPAVAFRIFKCQKTERLGKVCFLHALYEFIVVVSGHTNIYIIIPGDKSLMTDCPQQSSSVYKIGQFKLIAVSCEPFENIQFFRVPFLKVLLVHNL